MPRINHDGPGDNQHPANQDWPRWRLTKEDIAGYLMPYTARSAVPRIKRKSDLLSTGDAGQAALRHRQLLRGWQDKKEYKDLPLHDGILLHPGDTNACHLERSAIKTLIYYKLMGAKSKDPENLHDIFAASGSSPQTVSCERPDTAWQHMQYGDLSTSRPSTISKNTFSMRSAQDDRYMRPG